MAEDHNTLQLRTKRPLSPVRLVRLAILVERERTVARNLAILRRALGLEAV